MTAPDDDGHAPCADAIAAAHRHEARAALRAAEAEAEVWRLRIALADSTPGGIPTQQRRRPIDPLTDRETEVLQLLCGGVSTAGIAETLCVSPPTARNHIQSIMNKLGVHSRVEAVSVAHALGIAGTNETALHASASYLGGPAGPGDG